MKNWFRLPFIFPSSWLTLTCKVPVPSPLSRVSLAVVFSAQLITLMLFLCLLLCLGTTLPVATWSPRCSWHKRLVRVERSCCSLPDRGQAALWMQPSETRQHLGLFCTTFPPPLPPNFQKRVWFCEFIWWVHLEETSAAFPVRSSRLLFALCFPLVSENTECGTSGFSWKPWSGAC